MFEEAIDVHPRSHTALAASRSYAHIIVEITRRERLKVRVAPHRSYRMQYFYYLINWRFCGSLLPSGSSASEPGASARRFGRYMEGIGYRAGGAAARARSRCPGGFGSARQLELLNDVNL